MVAQIKCVYDSAHMILRMMYIGWLVVLDLTALAVSQREIVFVIVYCKFSRIWGYHELSVVLATDVIFMT